MLKQYRVYIVDIVDISLTFRSSYIASKHNVDDVGQHCDADDVDKKQRGMDVDTMSTQCWSTSRCRLC